MSIYAPRRRYQPEDCLRLPDMPVDVRTPSPASLWVRTEKRDWTHARKANPAAHLLPATQAWIRGLPAELRPVHLSQQYPRVANLVALEWNKGRACQALLDELLVGRRESREGFPAAVHRELRILRDACCEAMPAFER